MPLILPLTFGRGLWHYVFEVISMKDNEKTCHDCKHYRRHYVKMGRRFGEIHDGHCVYPGSSGAGPKTWPARISSSGNPRRVVKYHPLGSSLRPASIRGPLAPFLYGLVLAV